MTKQEIIDDMTKNIILDFENGALVGFHIEDERFADTLLAMFEKEKQELAREIFEKIASPRHEVGDTEIEYAWFESELKDLAKEYRVEL